MSRDLREQLRDIADEVEPRREAPADVIRRARRRMAFTLGAFVGVVVALLAGSLVGASALRDRPVPEQRPRPASRPNPPSAELALEVNLGDGEYVAFFSNRQLGHVLELFVMRPDGTGQKRLTAEPLYLAGAYRLSWAPDGESLLFGRGLGEGAGAIELIDVRTGELTRLQVGRTLENPSPQGPAWSPDGKQIVYFDQAGDLYVMDADGSGVRRLAESRDVTTFLDPTWSPQGTIAFDCDCGRESGIYVIRPDGSGMTRLLEGSMRQPVWSPDGTLIAFVQHDHIYVANADGSNKRQVTSGEGFDPAWSPDGQQIAFTRANGDYDIYVVGVDGTSERELTDDPAGDFSPAWRPPSG